MKKVLSLLLILVFLVSAIPVSAQEEPFTYDSLVEYAKKVNDYWIANHSWTPGYEWDSAAYYTGCMDAYYLTGIEKYREYATTWAVRNQWKGHGSTDSATWNGGNVYHADNQTCFQTYIDLYYLDGMKDEKKLARTLEIIDTQIATNTDRYWTWCDAIYMAAPIHAKLYALTGDEKYLDSLYRYFDFAKRTMYDGEGGINYQGEPVNLFFRDPSFIGSRIEGQKNIWARGTGWVMAAFARIFEYIPEDWEHYDYFVKTYREMAAACISCVKTDSEGRMYWSQSMLPTYPVAEHNPDGYETSGTGFITFSLYYGINSGLLDRDTYLPFAEGCLKYLTEVAIQSDGLVGYIQPIGSHATTATSAGSNYNFGVGATLSALSEASRFYGGVQGDMYPYLTRKVMGSVSMKIGSNYVYDGINVQKIDAAPYIDENGNTMVPLRAAAEAIGATVYWYDTGKAALLFKGDKVLEFTVGMDEYVVSDSEARRIFPMTSKIVIKNGRTYIPLRVAAEALDKNVYWNNIHKMIVIGPKAEPFEACHENLENLLNDILTTGTVPQRETQDEWEFSVSTPELESEDRIKIASAKASHTPEPENPATNAFDDNIATRWAATADCEIVFDLGKAQHVERVAVSFWKYAERGSIYEIHASEDGVNYTEYFNGTAPQGVEFNYTDIKADVRYIKLVGHGNTASNWTSVLEFIPYSK